MCIGWAHVTCRRHTTTGHRARHLLAAFILSALLLSSVGGIAHAATYRHRLLRYINHARTRHDLHPVRVNLRLSTDALQHTRTMVRRNRLFDVRDLQAVLDPYSWRRVGADAVGCAATLHRVHRRLMHHPPHRRIILDRRARRVGLGVIKDHGKSLCGHRAVWVTEIFYG